MDKTEFVKDFSEFYVEARKEGIETFADLTTLYAIYRKDSRADRLNKRSQSDPSEEKATERQKHFLMDLAYKNGARANQLVGPEGFEPSTFGFPLQKLFIPQARSANPNRAFWSPTSYPG